MMKLPVVSVITPTFNAASTVERTLLSVLGQRYKAVEHIFVDGLSEDSTLSIILSYQQNHNHIRLISDRDGGVYDAINRGLDICTGDWIIILGAGDEFCSEFVLAELFETGLFSDDQVVYGNVLIRGDTPWAKDGTVYDGPFTLEKLFRQNICHQAIFYPRSVIRMVGHYSLDYPVTADWDYNIRCWARYRFVFIDRLISVFHGGGTSSGEDRRSFFHDMPGRVIRSFGLNPADRSLYEPSSPFFIPMMRHRENELKEQAERLEKEMKQQIGKLEAENHSLQNHSGELSAALRAREEETRHLKRALENRETQLKEMIDSRERTITKLREELEEHKKVIASMAGSITWRIGRFMTAIPRLFRKKQT